MVSTAQSSFEERKRASTTHELCASQRHPGDSAFKLERVCKYRKKIIYEPPESAEQLHNYKRKLEMRKKVLAKKAQAWRDAKKLKEAVAIEMLKLKNAAKL